MGERSRHLHLALQFVRFNLVGTINTLIDVGVFALLTSLGTPPVAAQPVSYFCGMVNGFFLHKYWTFRQRRGSWGVQALKFVFVNLAGILLTTSIIALFEELVAPTAWGSTLILAWPAYVVAGKACALVAGSLLTFTANRWWVFRAE
ncbi:GtrA family protein [Spirochaeta thermophila]|uniref:Putative membrane spanning protein n=1 Tax=Winmispira thermophila (strain ATCC 49972 / DSM 6192 / RI 19.B1) TaxID=665571 RepID=E0RP40_WINT6|nr:GtrA family protein [Spirochaeta thermophila]ADN02702.1 putative membrane spanning protein [Spirochaeta thermophila DSM 6192]